MSNQHFQLAEGQNGRFEEKCDRAKRIGSLFMFVAGMAILCVAFSGLMDSDALFYTTIVAGLALATYGVVKAAFGCRVLVDTKTGVRVDCLNLYFQATSKNEILAAINNGDWDALGKGSRTTTTLPLCLRSWYTVDGQYASTMLMEYVPYEYVPVTGLQEIPAEARASFISSITHTK